jgi:hypothetical protein
LHFMEKNFATRTQRHKVKNKLKVLLGVLVPGNLFRLSELGI